MISIGIGLRWPWAKSDGDTAFYRSGLVKWWPNKAWEVQVTRDSQNIINLDLRIKAREDHAGVELTIGIWKYVAMLQFYDTRHWDDDKGGWQTYPRHETKLDLEL